MHDVLVDGEIEEQGLIDANDRVELNSPSNRHRSLTVATSVRGWLIEEQKALPRRANGNPPRTHERGNVFPEFPRGLVYQWSRYTSFSRDRTNG